MTKKKSFTEKVLEVVGKIPKGEVLTYAEVARCAGANGAGRAVGSIMSKNQDKSVPCHRVVRSDGSIGQYNGLRGENKLDILKREGVKFTKTNKIIFD
jgi:O-6-methylguanine DNA methyltransferase